MKTWTRNMIERFAPLLAFMPLCAVAAPTAGEDYLTVLTLTPDEANGSELFTQCAECHGDVGGGVIDGTTPRIAGQHYRVLVKQLLDFRHGLRPEFRRTMARTLAGAPACSIVAMS